MASGREAVRCRSRRWFLAAAGAMLATAATTSVGLAGGLPTPAPSESDRSASSEPERTTQTRQFTAPDFAAALSNGDGVAVEENVLRLERGADGYVAAGVFVSNEIEMVPFDDLVASWNATTPA